MCIVYRIVDNFVSVHILFVLEVLEYAAKIGIDTKTEHHLLPIALNGLMHPLPPEWKPW